MIQRLVEKSKKILYKILYPDFLQEQENRLLLNHPRLWSLKLYRVGYQAILVNILIIFLVFIWPIRENKLIFILIGGIVLVSIGEIVWIIYWVYKQDFYNIEKQYGDSHKSNVLLEMLGYSLCIMLIASPMIGFYVSLNFTAKGITSVDKLTTDLLILDSISNYTTIPESGEMLISNDKYNYKEYLKMILEENEKEHLKHKDFISDCDDHILKNATRDNTKNDKNFKSFAKDIFCNRENLSLFASASLSYVVFNDLVNVDIVRIYNNILKTEYRNNINERKNFINDNINQFIQSIKKGDPNKKVEKEISQYTQIDINETLTKDILELTIADPIKNAKDNAHLIYNWIYDIPFLNNILLSFFIILNLLIFFVFSFKKTYKTDFLMALSYIILLFFIFSYVELSIINFKRSLNTKKFILIVIYTLFNLMIGYYALFFRKNKEYLRFKTLNLIAFPITFVYYIYTIYSVLNLERVIILVLVLVSYFPFLPLIKRELIRQLSLPRIKL